VDKSWPENLFMEEVGVMGKGPFCERKFERLQTEKGGVAGGQVISSEGRNGLQQRSSCRVGERQQESSTRQ